MGEITSSDMKAAASRRISPPPSSRKKSTVEVRNATITSVASEPMLCTGSTRPSSNPRRSESRRPLRSTSAAGTASPTTPSQMIAGRTKRLSRSGAGSRTTHPTANPVQIARRSIGSSTAIVTARTNDAVISSTHTVSANASAHQPGIAARPTAAAAGPSPSASEAQKRRR